MNPKFEMLGDKIEEALRQKDGANTTTARDLLGIMVDFSSKEILILAEPIRDGMEKLQGPLEDLTISLLLELIFILSTLATLKEKNKKEDRVGEAYSRQCIWRIEILRNLIKKYRKINA